MVTKQDNAIIQTINIRAECADIVSCLGHVDMALQRWQASVYAPAGRDEVDKFVTAILTDLEAFKDRLQAYKRTVLHSTPVVTVGTNKVLEDRLVDIEVQAHELEARIDHNIEHTSIHVNELNKRINNLATYVYKHLPPSESEQ